MPKKLRKFILPLTLLLLILVILILNSLALKDESRLTLTSSENRFKLNFSLDRDDGDQFTQILTTLNLPANISEGVEFELDATSSAKLEFALPISSTFDISQNRITFGGTLQNSNLREQKMESFKLPSSTNLAIFGPQLMEYFFLKVNLPNELMIWVYQADLQEGQYLAIFDRDLCLIFKSDLLDLESLNELDIENQEESFYKKEESHGVTMHVTSTGTTFFQIGEWIFAASSYEAAQKMVDAQKSPANYLNFSTSQNPVSFYIHFKNGEDFPLNSEFVNTSIFQGAKSGQYLEKIEEIQFVLKGSSFSGLINIK